MAVDAGVIAVQGDVSEHATAIERAGAEYGIDVDVHRVRRAGVLPECDLLALPGGESTTISRLVHDTGIADEIRAHVAASKPLFATCAGLIVIAADAHDERVDPLGLLDIDVQRNAFGRQKESFEAMIDIEGLEEAFPAVFIRAPVIDRVGEDVSVLARWQDRPVAVEADGIVATAFHPELTPDYRVHRLAFASVFEAAVGDAPLDGVGRP